MSAVVVVMGTAMACTRVTLGLASLIASATLALAQTTPNPPGIPAPPAPVPIEKPDCSEKGVKAMEQQLEQLEMLEQATPETIGLFCAGIEMLSKAMDWKDDEPLPPAINDLAKQILKLNLTPRMVKSMCRQAEGEAGRNLRTDIGQLKARLQLCKGV